MYDLCGAFTDAAKREDAYVYLGGLFVLAAIWAVAFDAHRALTFVLRPRTASGQAAALPIPADGVGVVFVFLASTAVRLALQKASPRSTLILSTI